MSKDNKPDAIETPINSLADLFDGKAPEEWRSLYAGAYEWDADIGREVVED